MGFAINSPYDTASLGQATEPKQAQTEKGAAEQGTVKGPAGSKLGKATFRLKGDGAEFRIVAQNGSVFFQFKSRRTHDFQTVMVIKEDGRLGLTKRLTQNYVPRPGEAPK